MSSQPARENSAAPLVLVAEDEADARALVRAQLEPRGYRIVEAATGTAALEVCQRDRPDVVLLDLEMPELGGHEVLAGMKSDERLVDIPVVVLTAVSTIERALQLGAHDYVRKPYELTELVARVAAALRTKHLHDELRRREAELDDLVRKDPLTGLANRRHLEEHLTALSGSARRHHRPLSVLMFDLDLFKRVNQAQGHAIGDQVLRAVAERLTERLRAEDVAGRWDGESFLVLLPATDLDGAWVLGDRIRQAIAEPLVVGEGTEVVVTASVGCAMGDGTDPEDLIRRADAALSAAREAGRNRVVAEPGLV